MPISRRTPRGPGRRNWTSSVYRPRCPPPRRLCTARGISWACVARLGTHFRGGRRRTGKKTLAVQRLASGGREDALPSHGSACLEKRREINNLQGSFRECVPAPVHTEGR